MSTARTRNRLHNRGLVKKPNWHPFPKLLETKSVVSFETAQLTFSLVFE